MARYRKKPVIVEAVQWFPGKRVIGVTECVYTDPDKGTTSSEYGHVITIRGEIIKVVPGDWIITEPDGFHHYPCKPGVFLATYDLVTEPPP